MEVRQPSPVGYIVSVTHVVTFLRTLTANITNPCHIVSPRFVQEPETPGRRNAPLRDASPWRTLFRETGNITHSGRCFNLFLFVERGPLEKIAGCNISNSPRHFHKLVSKHYGDGKMPVTGYHPGRSLDNHEQIPDDEKEGNRGNQKLFSPAMIKSCQSQGKNGRAADRSSW